MRAESSLYVERHIYAARPFTVPWLELCFIFSPIRKQAAHGRPESVAVPSPRPRLFPVSLLAVVRKNYITPPFRGVPSVKVVPQLCERTSENLR